MTPAPEKKKTSVSLDTDTVIMLQSLKTQRPDLNQEQLINLAIRHYYTYGDKPEYAALTTHLATLANRVDALLAREYAPATVDIPALVAALHPLLSQISTDSATPAHPVGTKASPDASPAQISTNGAGKRPWYTFKAKRHTPPDPTHHW
jgi:hypothetical protein